MWQNYPVRQLSGCALILCGTILALWAIAAILTGIELARKAEP